MSRKTDNGNLGAKLELRRALLSGIRDGAKVFDCCRGEGKIWSALRKEFNVQYFGMDIARKQGALKFDSARYLEAGNCDFDVIDVDTYGSPWRHWLAILEHAKQDVIVFLTSATQDGGQGNGSKGRMTLQSTRLVGIPDKANKMTTIVARLAGMVTDAMLAQAEKRFQVTIALEAGSANAKYWGLKLKLKT